MIFRSFQLLAHKLSVKRGPETRGNKIMCLSFLPAGMLLWSSLVSWAWVWTLYCSRLDTFYASNWYWVHSISHQMCSPFCHVMLGLYHLYWLIDVFTYPYSSDCFIDTETFSTILFRTRFPKGGMIYRRQVANLWCQTLQELSVVKPGTPL